MRNRWKRLLSWLLLVAMLCTLLPTAVFAAETAETAGIAKVSNATLSNPFTMSTQGSKSFRIPAMVTLSDGTLVAAADARWNTTYDGGGLDTLVARSTDQGASWSYVFANKLDDNEDEATDTYDGAGATTFIDPALAVVPGVNGANDTIYMLVDIYPYGIALNGSGNTQPSTETGFNSSGKLLLKKDGESDYNYYLDGETIYSSTGTAVSDYTVDGYFNLKNSSGEVVSNLFFSDSPYQVVRTGFLYLTKSTDKGATWSAPTLLNVGRLSTTELVTLVAPGRGLVTTTGKGFSEGTIVYPVYSFHGDNAASSNTQRMSFIYSTDGVNWTRTSELDYNWASESAVIELSDGTLRFFFRNGTKHLCYVDYSYTSGWSTPVEEENISVNSNCQISAITLSKTVDGNQVVVVSCPGGPSGGSNASSASERLNGKIYVGVIDATKKTISWDYNVAVDAQSTSDCTTHSNTNFFMYSCLTELKDTTATAAESGTSTINVGILYEDHEHNWGYGSDNYYEMSTGTYAITMAFDETTTDGGDTTPTAGTLSYETTEMKVGDTQTITLTGDGNATWESSDESVITLSAGETTLAAVADTASVVAKAEAAGEATITATSETNQTYSVTINVAETDTEDGNEEGGNEGDGTTTDEIVLDSGNATVDATEGSEETTYVVEDVTVYKLVETPTVGKQYLIVNSNTGTGYGLDSDTTGYSVTAFTGGSEYYSSWDETTNTGTAFTAGTDTYTSASDAYLWTVGSGYTFSNGTARLGVDRGNISFNRSNNWTYQNNQLQTTGGKNTDYLRYNNGWSVSQENASNVYFYEPVTIKKVTETTTTAPGTTGGTYSVEAENKVAEAVENSVVELSSALNFTPDGGTASAVTSGWEVAYEVVTTKGNPSVIMSIDGSDATLSGVVGTAVVKATYTSGDLTAWKEFTVTTTAPTYNETIDLMVEESQEISLSLTDGQTVEWSSLTGSAVTVTDNGNGSLTVTAGTAEGTASISAVVKNSDGVVVANYNYTITVSDVAVTEKTLSLMTGSTGTIDLGLTDGQTVEWGTLNGDVVTVQNTDGVLTLTSGTTEGTATISAVVKNANGGVIARYNYTITVANIPTYSADVSIPLGTDADISVTLGDGQYVKWTSADSAYVGVAGNYDLDTWAYTNGAVLFGQQVTETGKPIVVTGTVYNDDGTVAAIYYWNVTVTAADGTATSVSRYYDVDHILNCTLYYSINGGELVQVNGTGVSLIPGDEVDPITVIDGTWYGDLSLIFFAAPNEGYAMTHLFVEASADQYYMLADGNEDGTGSSAWPFLDGIDPENLAVTVNNVEGTYSMDGIAAYYKAYGDSGVYNAAKGDAKIWKTIDGNLHGLRWALLEGYMHADRLQELYADAIKLGCTAITTVTKGQTNTSNTGTADDPISVCAVAQKLAYLEKEITSTDTEISLGETISYKVTVTVPKTSEVVQYWDGSTLTSGSTSTFTYSDMNVDDTLYDLTWTQTSATSSTTDDLEYTATYSITVDLANYNKYVTDGTITNTATLSYNFTSSFGKGYRESEDTESANVTVKLHEFVIDFGLPVTIVDEGGFLDAYSITDATANYGTVGGWETKSGTNNQFTYVPDEILTEEDYVHLTLVNNNDQSVAYYEVGIIPATNVHYEETFLTADSGTADEVTAGKWATVGTPSTDKTQAASNSTADGVYGYDAAYASDNSTYSNGSAYVGLIKGADTMPKATFTFTGNGFELIGECAQDTGVLYVRAQNQETGKKKVYIVDTYFSGSLRDANNSIAIYGGMTYQIPVVHDLGLDYSTYDVTVYGYYLPNTGATTASMDGGLDGKAIAASMGDADAEIEVTVMNDVLGGEDKNVSLFADYETGLKVYVDAIRVYEPLDEAEPAAYASAVQGTESNPTYLSLYEDIVTENKDWNSETTAGDDDTNKDSFYMYVEDVSGNNEVGTLAGYQTNGPQNEIYLKPKSAIGFQVDDPTGTVHVSAKVIDGGTATMDLNGADPDTEVATNTEMYYSVTPTAEGYVIVTNASESTVLSLVDVKLIGCTLVPLTSSNVEAMLLSLEPGWTNPFTDVSEGSYYYDAVAALNGNGVIKGLTDTTFGPDEKTTRGQVVTMLYRLEGEPQAGTADFSDVKKGKYYTKAVAWAAEVGIVKGYEDGTFRPEENVSRQELVTFLYRYVQYKGENVSTAGDLGGYTDGGKVMNYAKKPMAWAVDNGIVKGYTDNTLRPLAEASRAELAALLYRILNSMN